MTGSTPPVLNLERQLHAPAHRVWRCMTDPVLMSKWWCHEGWDAVIDVWTAEVGAPWRIIMRGPEGKEYIVGGRVETLDAERQLTLSWAWEHSDNPASRVHMRLESAGTGTRFTLVHEGLPSADIAKNHEGGWTAILARLRATLTDARGPYFARHAVTIAAPSEAIWTALTTSEGHRSFWTADCDVPDAVHEVAVFRFLGGTTRFHMRIDALDSPRRVAWTCVDGPEDWVGTTVDWTLIPKDDGTTQVLFTHDGWRHAGTHFAGCSHTWAGILTRLRDYVQTGEPQPYFT